MLSLVSTRHACQLQPRHVRYFSPTPISLARKLEIRVKSKKQLAARAKRKADLLAAEIKKAEKLPLKEAINVLRAVEVASPNAMYELYVKAEMGKGVAVPKGRYKFPRQAKQQTEDKILVFAEGKLAEEARKAGAHYVGGIELVDAVVKNRIKATTYLSTFDLIKRITPPLGRVLGPLGLMPSERRGTVTNDIKGYIRGLAGTTEWKADKNGSIRIALGKLHFPVSDVVKNFEHIMSSIKDVTGNSKNRSPNDKKPVTQISKVLLSSSHGPGIRVEDY